MWHVLVLLALLGGAGAFTFDVTVTGLYGAPLPGVSVTLSCGGTYQNITDSGGNTSFSGLAPCFLSSYVTVNNGMFYYGEMDGYVDQSLHHTFWGKINRFWKYTLIVILRTDAGKPIPDYEVDLYWPGNSMTQTTDGNGTISFYPLYSQSYFCQPNVLFWNFQPWPLFFLAGQNVTTITLIGSPDDDV